MRGGGGRGSSVWSKVGLCAVRPHAAVFMSFAGVVIIVVIIDRHSTSLLQTIKIIVFRRYFQSLAF